MSKWIYDNKHNLIKYKKSLGNYYNEHLSSKLSSGHAMQLRAMLKSIACPINTWCINTWCIKETKAISNRKQQASRNGYKNQDTNSTKEKLSFKLKFLKVLNESTVNIHKLKMNKIN